MSTLSRYTRDEFLTPFDRLFDDFFNTSIGPSFYSKGSFPKVDVVEYDNKYVLEADVGGLSKDDVSVELEGDILAIRGGKKANENSTNSQKGRYLYKEIKRSSFVRSFSIGEGIDRSGIKADFENGVIKIDLPKVKVEQKQPQKTKLL